jgi:hypothetical protein
MSRRDRDVPPWGGLMDDPTRHLIDPGFPEGRPTGDISDPFIYFGIASPANWINQLITELTGQDIVAYISETLTGEWAAFIRCGMAFERLGRFFQDFGINLEYSTLSLGQGWQGSAADAASRYFSDLAAATSGTQLALYEVARSYEKVANGVWLLASQLSAIIEAICDAAILAGVAAAGGTILVETGVGAFVGYGLAAAKTAEIIELVGKASVIIQAAGTAILGVTGFAMDVANQGGSLKKYPLPGKPYDHPAVS